MRFALLAALLFSLGCGASRPGCMDVVRSDPPGLMRGTERIWRVSGTATELQWLVTNSHRCLRRDELPIAFVQDETGEFLGEMRRFRVNFDRRTRRESFFDDFNFNGDGSGVSYACTPSEWATLKESHEIESLHERRVFTRSKSLNNQEIQFASAWLTGCVPFIEPIVWLGTDGELIGVYRGRRLDRFK